MLSFSAVGPPAASLACAHGVYQSCSMLSEPGCCAGICFGREIMQCYWFGVDRTRWARTTHALRMGREYTEPFEGFGTSDRHEIASLCWFMCCLGESIS